jgi:hypothetical protein
MSFLAMSLVAMQSAAQKPSEGEVRFDTDSHSIGIDNRCSKCISPDPLDFIGKVENTNTTISGFGGVGSRFLCERRCDVLHGIVMGYTGLVCR